MSLAKFTNLRSSSIAFFLCDIQEKFRTSIINFPKVVAVASRMIKASEILSIPLIVTEQYPKGLGSIVKELDISSTSFVYPKTLYSMVIPPVLDLIQRQRIETVVLFGIETHVCIYQTALDLLEKSIGVYVVSDGVSSRHQAHIEDSINSLRSMGAVVGSSEAILFQILKSSDHPKFKEISNLVKATDLLVYPKASSL